MIGNAIGTSGHKATGLTPFFVNFSREQKLDGLDYRTDNVAEDGIEKVPIERDRIRFDRVFNRYKKWYNLRKWNETYNVGSRVLNKNYVLSDASRLFSAKLVPKFVGPCYVRKKVSPWTFILQDEQGVYKGMLHAKDIKKFNLEDDYG